MAGSEAAADITWRRVPLDRETMQKLVRRTNAGGLAQAGGFLLLLAASSAAAWWSWGRLPWWATVLLLFVHGTFWAFLLNGFHELVHNTVFKSRALNAVFVWVYSFLSWNNPVAFKASHNRHHLNTLHPPWDLEVVLPIRLKLVQFLLSAVVDVPGAWGAVRDTILVALGVVRGEWQLVLFPPGDRKVRRPLVRWAWIILAGHALIIAAAAVTGLWQMAVIFSAARFYGGWLQWICNNTQHTGLQDNVDDFRLCCRTVTLNPVVQFLYFHMNFHIEHHMYASVPCYHLPRLHRLIEAQLPPSPRLIPAWREIASILRRQKTEPGYKHVQPLPAAAAV